MENRIITVELDIATAECFIIISGFSDEKNAIKCLQNAIDILKNRYTI